MASKYLQQYETPEGFEELLHDFIKEVLRNQPEDLIEFAALYFKCVQEVIIIFYQQQVLDYPKRGQNIPCDFKPTVPELTYKKKEINGEYNPEEYYKKIEDYERNKMAIEKEIKNQKNEISNENNQN